MLSVKRWGRRRLNFDFNFCVMGSVCVSVYKNPKPSRAQGGRDHAKRANDALLIFRGNWMVLGG